MEANPTRILAVNPGSHYCGIAVFDGPDLRDWRIRVLEGSPKQRANLLAKQLLQLVAKYSITAMAIKVVHPSRGSKALSNVVRNVHELARENKLSVSELSIAEIKKRLCTGKRANKRELMRLLAENYPFLRGEFESELKSKYPYRIRMFEAVAVGYACQAEIEKR